ncbi:MAG TPA: 50S ribosomal protein L3 N(5)-glutamine methyltransferase [Opitutaceae bacterium]|jgi:ribosomal protein L3 glutamine methyltransferase|nr:50S ribosomal protein L3 N(5)-glutamine methyltransferase [Opitutaceae bacterium]
MRKPKSDLFVGAARLATLGDWLAFAEQLYGREGVALGQVAASAHDEALYLLLHALGLPLDSDAGVLGHRLTPVQATAVKKILRRRVRDRVPAAYLTREAFLGEHRFYVDERVIIPRSYFLEILPSQLGPFVPDAKKVLRAVDVCTGSGCLAVLLAHHFPHARVDAVDLSTDALAVAEINVRAHHLTRRVKLFESDVFDDVPSVPRSTGSGLRDEGSLAGYDVILSNPPYVPTRELRGLAPEFKQEPRLALDGGADGLVIIRKLLRQARDRLAPEGVVLLEVGGLRAAMQREFAALVPHWFHSADGEDCCCAIRAEKLLGVGRY